MKKVLILMLVLSFIFVSNVGCSNSGNAGESNGTTNTMANSITNATTIEKTEEAQKSLTFHQVMSDAYAMKSPIKASTPEALKEVQDAIFKQTGIEVKTTVVPNAVMMEKLNLMLAGGEEIDCFDSGALGKGGVQVLAKMGLIQPLNDLIEKYGPNIRGIWNGAIEDDLYASVTDAKGLFYAIPTGNPTRGSAVYIRKDWLDKYNLPLPATIDDLENAFKVIKENDPAGNGETIPLLASPGGSDYMALAAGFMDAGYGAEFVDSDGKVKPIAFNPGFKDYVARMSEWYKAGYIHKEYAGLTDPNRLVDINKSGKVFCYAGWHSRATAAIAAIKDNFNGEFVLLEKLRGPKGETGSMTALSDIGYVIYKESKNAEAVIRYINWEYSNIDNYMLALNGIDGKHWRRGGKPGETASAEGLATTDYCAEMLVAPNGAMTAKMDSQDPLMVPVFYYYRTMLANKDKAKLPSLYSTSAFMDWTAIKDKTAYNDVNTMFSEQLSKFIMNSRSISEYDTFLNELEKVGVEKVIEAMTEEYNRVK